MGSATLSKKTEEIPYNYSGSEISFFPELVGSGPTGSSEKPHASSLPHLDFPSGLYELIVQGKWPSYASPQSEAQVRLYLILKEHVIGRQVRKAIFEFKRRVKKIREARAIAYASVGNKVTIWTFLKRLERKHLYRVYDEEQKLSDKYPALIFDFTVLAFDDQPIPPNFALERFRQMTRAAKHKKKAQHNEKFYAAIKHQQFNDWAVTGLFYAAIHYVEGYLSKKGIIVRNHSDRLTYINRVSELRHIHKHYRILYDMSINARYRFKNISAKEVQSLYDDDFLPLKNHMSPLY